MSDWSKFTKKAKKSTAGKVFQATKAMGDKMGGVKVIQSLAKQTLPGLSLNSSMKPQDALANIMSGGNISRDMLSKRPQDVLTQWGENKNSPFTKFKDEYNPFNAKKGWEDFDASQQAILDGPATAPAPAAASSIPASPGGGVADETDKGIVKDVTTAYDEGGKISKNLAQDYYTALFNRGKQQATDWAYGTPEDSGMIERMNMRGQTADSGVFQDALAQALARESTGAALEGAKAGYAGALGIGGQTSGQLFDNQQAVNQRAWDKIVAEWTNDQSVKQDEKDRTNSLIDSLRAALMPKANVAGYGVDPGQS